MSIFGKLGKCPKCGGKPEYRTGEVVCTYCEVVLDSVIVYASVYQQARKPHKTQLSGYPVPSRPVYTMSDGFSGSHVHIQKDRDRPKRPPVAVFDRRGRMLRR